MAPREKIKLSETTKLIYDYLLQNQCIKQSDLEEQITKIAMIDINIDLMPEKDLKKTKSTIKRRVYDVISVFIALNYVSRQPDKTLKWIGPGGQYSQLTQGASDMISQSSMHSYPMPSQHSACETEDQEVSRLLQEEAQLVQELEVIYFLKNRNAHIQEAGGPNHAAEGARDRRDQAAPAVQPSERLQLPFVVAACPGDDPVEVYYDDSRLHNRVEFPAGRLQLFEDTRLVHFLKDADIPPE